MSVENLQRIVDREIAVQRRSRFYLAGFGLAVVIVLAGLVTAI